MEWRASSPTPRSAPPSPRGGWGATGRGVAGAGRQCPHRRRAPGAAGAGGAGHAGGRGGGSGGRAPAGGAGGGGAALSGAAGPVPVLVVGGSGYVAGEALRLLGGHPRRLVR